MALVLADRVRETTTTAGTGTITLLGAVPSCQSFAAVGNGNTTYYTIVAQSGTEWEVGIGTYTSAGTTLSRDTVLSSSNSGSLVNFSAGTKDVFVDYPASKAVYENAAGNVDGYPITGGAINNTTIGATTPSTGKFTEVAIPTATGETTLLENTTITGWIYSNNSFSVAAQESAPTGLFIGSAGTKMYVNGSTGDDVNEYTLGTAWDITTATFVQVFSTAAQDTGPQDIFFKPDGLTMFVMGGVTDTVYQYTLGTAWNVSTASYASKSFSVTTQETAPLGLWFKPDGLVMYVVGSTADSVFQYDLATAWDVSTASYGGIFYSFATQEATASQVNLSSDGLKMWVVGTTGKDIWEYTLGTAWNVSTATPVNNFYVGFQDSNPTGMFIDSSAINRVYMVGTTNDTVYQYNTEANSLQIDTEKLYVDGQLSVNGNLVAGSNAYVDGALTVQGAFTATGGGTFSGMTATGTLSLTSSTTSTTSLGTSQTTGTLFIGGTSGTGTMTIGQSTASQTTNIQAGATTSGSAKTINIGTAGLSGSTTTIAIGSNVSGSLGSIAIQSPTVNIGQTATQLSITNTASAVNYVQVTGGATGASPTISTQGSDTNRGLVITTKGSGVLDLQTGGVSRIQVGSSGTGVVDLGVSSSGGIGFQVVATSSQSNYLSATGALTANIPTISALGSVSNVGMAFISKGTGAIDLAAGSSGVNISNGGTVTAITGTAGGTAYTSAPTVAISAPTTAGGVQATASAGMSILTSALVSGGTGYTVNDALTFVGGTGTAVTITVTGVSGGVVTTYSISFGGTYTVVPTGTISTTGGTGTGATFSVSAWQVRTNGFTITNAGSGYVEQPTVTFSGGGGSGAAAYATVGSGTTVRGLGSTMSLSTASGEGLRITDNGVQNAGYLNVFGSASTLGLYANGGGTNLAYALVSKGTGAFNLSTNGTSANQQLAVSHTASAVNYVQVTGAATGSGPIVSAQGSDTNIDLLFSAKGTAGSHVFRTNTTVRQFQVNHVTSAVNYGVVTGSITGNAVPFSVAGTDTNISAVFQSKGTGAIDLAAGSSGVNISNGGTVTAVTRTATGSGYTSFPSVAITAPTTAGGVQATVSVATMVQVGGTVQSGGTGYTVGDTLTVVGGTFTSVAATMTVTAASGGVVTAITPLNFGQYTVLPTNPVSVTGGTGSGATFNLTYGIGSAPSFTITNAGSGYVEQPTVTFSGGGGSGAAAYASVGGQVIIRSLASPLSLYTQNGEGFRVQNSGTASTSFWTAFGTSTTPILRAISSVSGAIGTESAVPLQFQTNTSVEQLRVSHTASAVNYVQVTGAATGSIPVVSAQGSDTNVSLYLSSKGTGGVRLSTNGQITQLRASNTANAVNFVNVTGAIAGAAPVYSVDGSDTNIDLALTTKGTGGINLNTGNGTQFRVADTTAGGTAVNYIQTAGNIAGASPRFISVGADTNVGIVFSSKGTGDLSFRTNGTNQTQFLVSHTASAVNYVQVTGAATAAYAQISAQGSDTNTGILYTTKGTGEHRFSTAASITAIQFRVRHINSPANYCAVIGAPTGSAPEFQTLGTDTDIDLTLTPKGTGNVRFGTYTGTALSIAGYIEIKDSGGTVRKLAVVA